MTLTARLALPCGCVALLVLSDEDRPPPSPVHKRPDRDQHHDRCGCDTCRVARETAAHQTMGLEA